MKKTLKKIMAFMTALSIVIASMPNMIMADTISSLHEAAVSENLIPEQKTIELVKKQKLNDPALALAMSALSKADKKVVSVKNGVITAKRAGRVNVKASEGEYVINVTEPHFGKKKYTASVGEFFAPEFEAYGHTAEYSVPAKYAENVRFVQGKGYEALKRGSAKISAVINGVEYTASLKIDDPRLSEEVVSLNVGGGRKLKLYDCAQNVVWSSSDSSVVSVKNGRLKGVSRGSAVVSALCGSRTYKASIYVSSCKLTTKTLLLNAGDSKRVGISGIEDPDYKDEWFIAGADKGIISVLPNGTVNGLKKGNAKIYTAVGGKKYQIKVKVVDGNSAEHSHVYEKTYQDPADLCTMHVETIYSCSCGSAYVERGEAGHIYELAESRDSTCSEPAADMYICSRCGITYIKQRDIAECPLKEHNLTHSSGKEDLWKCSVCHLEFVRNSDGSFSSYTEHKSDAEAASSSAMKDGNSSSMKGENNASSSMKNGSSSTEKGNGSTSSLEKENGSSSSAEKENDSSSSAEKGNGSSSSAEKGNGSTSSVEKENTASSSAKKLDDSSSKKENSNSSTEKETVTEETHVHSAVAKRYIDESGEYYFEGYECPSCGRKWQAQAGEREFGVVTYNTAYPQEADMINEVLQQRIENDEVIALSAKKAGAATVPGYTFLGWSSRYGADSPDYNVRDCIKAVDGGILYAVWQRTKFTINYVDLLEAPNDNPAFFTNEKEIIMLEPLSKPGYEFCGWADENGELVDSINTSCLKNRELTAKWKIIEYSIEYLSDNPNCVLGDLNPAAYDVTMEDFVLNNPETPAGYEFLGWTSDETAEPAKTATVNASKTGSLIYTAHFKAVPYQIKYVLNDGENCEDNQDAYTVESEIDFMPAHRMHYSFEGWYTSNDFAKDSKIDKISKGTTGDITLYAKWVKNEFDYSALDVTTVYDGKSYSIAFKCNDSDACVEFSTTGDEGSWNKEMPVYQNAGSYIIYFRITKDNFETVIGSRKLIINKAAGEMREPYARYLVYNGQPQVLISQGNTTTGRMMYSEGTSSTGIYDEALPTAVAAGTYHVWYYSKGDDNHFDTERKGVTVSILKAASAITKKPVSRSLIYNGKEQALVTAGECQGGKMLYALAAAIGSPSAYSDNIPTAAKAGKYYVYYKCGGDDNHEQSQAEYIEVNIEKGAAYVQVAPAAKSLTYSGNSQELVNAGTAAGGDIYYGIAEQIGGAVYYSKSVPTATNAGKYYVYYKVVGDENHTDSAAAYTLVTIAKAAGYVSALPTANSLTYNGSYQALINPGSTATGKMYYKLSSSGTYSVSVPSALAAGEYTVYYYSVGDANHSDSSVGSVSVKIAPKEMTVAVTDGKTKYTGSAVSGGARISVTDPSSGYTVKYGTSQGSYLYSAIPTYTEIGTYTVYYQVSAANYATKTGTLSISITKADGSYTKPTAVSGLTYTGKQQTLIRAGSSSTGTMYYRLGKTGEYKAELPKAVDAGKYEVYYYSKGDAYHLDTTPSYIEVTVAQTDLTIEFLNTQAIFDLQAHYPTVRVTSSALLGENDLVGVFFNKDNGSNWAYIEANDPYVNCSYGRKLPFEWKPLKINTAYISMINYNMPGTYTIYYKAMVYEDRINGTVSPNFKIKYASCKLSIIEDDSDD